jgi:hypothetical protein
MPAAGSRNRSDLAMPSSPWIDFDGHTIPGAAAGLFVIYQVLIKNNRGAIP